MPSRLTRTALPGPRVLLYALGGGLGHATRALALGRQLARAGARPHLVVSSALAAALPLDAELLAAGGGEVTRLDPQAGADALREAVRALVVEGGWDALVVDTFPRGLLGELPPLLAASRAPAVWVQRDLSPRYVAWADLRAAARGFALVLRPGEGVPGARGARTVTTAPWLVRDAHELLAPAAARAALAPEVPADRRLVVVVGTGSPEEAREVQGLAARLAERLPGAAVRCLTPPFADGALGEGALGDGALGDGALSDGALLDGAGAASGARWVWPLVGHLPGVDLLVGAGGYHTVYEARATGTPLLALPRPRLYDRQALRLDPVERVRHEEQLMARAAALLPTLPPRGPARPFVNGARDGAAALLSLLAPCPVLVTQEA